MARPAVFLQPSGDQTNAGRTAILEAKDRITMGSASAWRSSEAVEVAAQRDDTKYCARFSVLNHVLLHQTIVGLEEAIEAARNGRRLS